MYSEYTLERGVPRSSLEREGPRSSVSPKSGIPIFEPQAQIQLQMYQIRFLRAHFLENTSKLIV